MLSNENTMMTGLNAFLDYDDNGNTTSLRILESCWRDHGKVQAYQAETDLFIIPGFEFGVADLLLTNFHLPKSTLLMLISAFAGKAFVEDAYRHAIAQDYRFFSYGDACLMERS